MRRGEKKQPSEWGEVIEKENGGKEAGEREEIKKKEPGERGV